jgi:flagellar hook-associated protein 2
MAISTDIISTLGAGSGVDVKTLAQNLADAEIAPRKDLINTKISQTEAKISAYGYIKTALLDLQNAFKQLDDAADFASITPTVSQPNSVGVSTTFSAQAGSYNLNVTQIATAQSTASTAFAARDTQINGGAAFSLNLSVGGVAKPSINVTTATPAGVVSAINGANAGLQAQLLHTGDPTNPYTVVVTGEIGAGKSFSISAVDGASASIAGLSFTNNLETARDASFTLNGMPITRASNQVSDLISGVTFNLYGATNGAARIDLNRQTQAITDNLKGLVTAYNDLELTLKELGNPDSEIEEVGGALNNNSILYTVRSMVRGYITSNSSTPSGGLSAARDVGLSFDREGKLTLDETKLASALQSKFDDVVTLFSAGTNGKSIYSSAPSGVAGDAVVKLDAMMRTSGLINTQSESASKKVADYKGELTKLDERMQQILARYTQQFSVMESLVGSSKALQTSLKSSFEGMMATYTNKG